MDWWAASQNPPAANGTIDPAGEVAAAVRLDEPEVVDGQERLRDLSLRRERKRAADLASDA
jgi:hypothetical protein